MTKYFDEQTMAETAAYYEKKMAEMFLEIQRLRKENTGLKGKNRGFRRSIKRLKTELAEYRKQDERKQHYRNGRRGTRFNG